MPHQAAKSKKGRFLIQEIDKQVDSFCSETLETTSKIDSKKEVKESKENKQLNLSNHSHVITSITSITSKPTIEKTEKALECESKSNQALNNSHQCNINIENDLNGYHNFRNFTNLTENLKKKEQSFMSSPKKKSSMTGVGIMKKMKEMKEMKEMKGVKKTKNRFFIKEMISSLGKTNISSECNSQSNLNHLAIQHHSQSQCNKQRSHHIQFLVSEYNSKETKENEGKEAEAEAKEKETNEIFFKVLVKIDNKWVDKENNLEIHKQKSLETLFKEEFKETTVIETTPSLLNMQKSSESKSILKKLQDKKTRKTIPEINYQITTTNNNNNTTMSSISTPKNKEGKGQIRNSMKCNENLSNLSHLSQIGSGFTAAPSLQKSNSTINQTLQKQVGNSTTTTKPVINKTAYNTVVSHTTLNTLTSNNINSNNAMFDCSINHSISNIVDSPQFAPRKENFSQNNFNLDNSYLLNYINGNLSTHTISNTNDKEFKEYPLNNAHSNLVEDFEKLYKIEKLEKPEKMETINLEDNGENGENEAIFDKFNKSFSTVKKEEKEGEKGNYGISGKYNYNEKQYKVLKEYKVVKAEEVFYSPVHNNHNNSYFNFNHSTQEIKENEKENEKEKEKERERESGKFTSSKLRFSTKEANFEIFPNKRKEEKLGVFNYSKNDDSPLVIISKKDLKAFLEMKLEELRLLQEEANREKEERLETNDKIIRISNYTDFTSLFPKIKPHKNSFQNEEKEKDNKSSFTNLSFQKIETEVRTVISASEDVSASTKVLENDSTSINNNLNNLRIKNLVQSQSFSYDTKYEYEKHNIEKEKEKK